LQEGDVADIDNAKEIDPLISALNLIMQRQAAQRGVRFGKNRYFFYDDQERTLGPRLQALMGFYSSVRPVYKQLMVNVNVCMAPFHEPGKLSDAMHAFLSRSHEAALQNFMTKVKISTNYRGYKCVRAITSVSSFSARRQKFYCKELGRSVTVEDFFLKSMWFNLNYLGVLTLFYSVQY